MSRDKRYQRLLNSKRWRELRAWKLTQTRGYCEICYREGWRGLDAMAVDVHHIVPVESVIDQGEEAMARVCFDPNNLMALCIKHHSASHKDMGKDTAESVQRRKMMRRVDFLRSNDPHYDERDEKTEEAGGAADIQETAPVDNVNDAGGRHPQLPEEAARLAPIKY